MEINQTLAQEFHLKQEQVDNTVALIDEGATIPFIARYRKERTGSLDDQLLRELSERLSYLRNLEKRKGEIRSAIEEQGKLTEELTKSIAAASTLVEAEDLYRPYKPKRKTRASIAREKGLEPLAAFLLEQGVRANPQEEAAGYLSEQEGKEVACAEDALQGAMDIIAEDLSDNAVLRRELRSVYNKEATLTAKAADPEAETVYQTYYDFAEPIRKVAPHRILAIDRGEKEKALKVAVALSAGTGERIAARFCQKNMSPCGLLVKEAAEDAFRRLIGPSMEREIRADLTAAAAEQAIQVFSSNLRQLLMQPPVKGSVTLGLDPGYRTGCKVAVVDDTGRVLDTGVAYITHSAAQQEQARAMLRKMIETHGVTTVAIGNGTASRETEAFAAALLKEIPRKISYMVVSEAGASVYSASKLAAAEFPDYDVSLRSAVSIARRLQDPLAELVKIDPKAIGVGQYQHDMPPARLDEALSGVVEDCVNAVGVDLNTASHSLLSHIAGINATVARNIVKWREENGAFPDRKTLMKVEKLGKKAFEQCAGFLRVPGGKDPLDNTAVHPESYGAAKKLLEVCGFSLQDLQHGRTTPQTILQKVEEIGLPVLAESVQVGIPTLEDIVRELQKPGRDPRDELPPPLLRSGDVMELKDLLPGMELTGTVRNIVDFGVFVDVGVHEDGLVHISQLGKGRFIKHPLEVVKVGDIVTVWVLSVDMARKRVALTMVPPKDPADGASSEKGKKTVCVSGASQAR